MDTSNLKEYSFEYNGIVYIAYRENVYLNYKLKVHKVLLPTRVCVIPDRIDGMDVCSLSPYLFRDNTYVRTVDIKASIKTIPKECFYGCTSLEYLLLSSVVYSIEKSAFSYCRSLKSFALKTNDFYKGVIIAISSYAFSDCVSLERFVAPRCSLLLGSDVFNNCTSLKEVVLPQRMVDSNPKAIYNNKSIERIVYLGNEINGFLQGVLYRLGLKDLIMPDIEVASSLVEEYRSSISIENLYVPIILVSEYRELYSKEEINNVIGI